MATGFKLAVINLPAGDPEKLSGFYSTLLGIELTRSPTDETHSYSAPISEDGVYLSVKKKERSEEGILALFAVDNLENVVAAFQAAGGKLVSKHALPISPSVKEEYAKGYQKLYGPLDRAVPDTMGVSAVVVDPEGNRIGLMEIEEHAQVMFRVGARARAKGPSPEAVQAEAKNLERAFVSRRKP